MKVHLTPLALERLEILHGFVAEKNPAAADRALSAVLDALASLEAHPGIGHPAEEDPELRELLIPFAAAGYVALYRIDEQNKRAVMLSIRHYREAGY